MLQVPERDRYQLKCLIDGSSKSELIRSFRLALHDRISMTPEQFVDGICERIYHEGNYSESLKLFEDGNTGLNFNYYLFHMFVTHETHLDLVDRRGYTWENSRFVFVDIGGKVLSLQGYVEARNRVIDALARKAIDLFSDWQGANPPEGSNDNRKLFFRSLKDYL